MRGVRARTGVVMRLAVFRKSLAAAGVALGLSVAGPAGATVLTFDLVSIGNSVPVNQNYGDRVDAGFADAIGTYGSAGGATPNVVVDYDGNIQTYIFGYSDLTNVVFEQIDGRDLVIEFIADAGFEVGLFGLDIGSCEGTLGGCGGANNPFDVIVTGGTKGQLFSQGVTANSTTATPVSFGGGLFDTSLRLTLEVGLLGGGSDGIAVDNIEFAQRVAQPAAIPLPAPALLLLAGLGALGGLARARRAA
jgi:hypothetical protein